MSNEFNPVALRKIAEDASSPGPWKAQEGFKTGGGRVLTPDGYALPGCFNCGENDGVYEESDAAHIAAFDPPTAIQLLDRLEAAEAALAKAWDEGHSLGDDYGYAVAKHDDRGIGMDPPATALNPYRFIELDGEA